MQSLYRCIGAIFIAGESSFSFISQHVQSVYLISGISGLMHLHEFSCSLVHLFKFFLRPLKSGPEYLTMGTAQAFIPLMRFLLYSLVSSSFLVLLRHSFLLFFLHLHQLVGVRFQYAQVFVSFFFSEHSDLFLVQQFCSFRHVSFPASHYQHGLLS